jgi:hypothetical protein
MPYKQPKGVNALVGVPGKTVSINGRAVPPELLEGGRVYVRLDTSGKYTLLSP